LYLTVPYSLRQSGASSGDIKRVGGAAHHLERADPGNQS
jgi:hypothetical protein